MHAKQRGGRRAVCTIIARPAANTNPPLISDAPTRHTQHTHTQMGIGGPRPVTDSWEHMWWDNLQWKRWKIPRTGPAFPQDMYWQ